MFKLNLCNKEGKELKKVELDAELFDGIINQVTIYQAVKLYQANRRRGLASTKTRGEVSGGGVKPWRQKGTGRARHGSIRSPIWRKGGVVFGPHPRDYRESLPKSIKRVALISSINSKLKDNQVILIDELDSSVVKTKDIFKVFKNLKTERVSTLLVLDKISNELKRSLRNISNVTLVKSEELNAELVLANKNLVLTENSLEALIKHLKK